ncbi:hypothetical protein B0H16DRAFT_1895675 [Mycena metata]|uniref:Uncharacterized protein n=1 Tax=Mycena metata TaxID=1033252 RepID=A0AAD7HLX0_9AGAR|nr:hypothetical protein B0H16DRAFT_1895675 [Mycena metata]
MTTGIGFSSAKPNTVDEGFQRSKRPLIYGTQLQNRLHINIGRSPGNGLKRRLRQYYFALDTDTLHRPTKPAPKSPSAPTRSRTQELPRRPASRAPPAQRTWAPSKASASIFFPLDTDTLHRATEPPPTSPSAPTPQSPAPARRYPFPRWAPRRQEQEKPRVPRPELRHRRHTRDTCGLGHISSRPRDPGTNAHALDQAAPPPPLPAHTVQTPRARTRTHSSLHSRRLLRGCLENPSCACGTPGIASAHSHSRRGRPISTAPDADVPSPTATVAPSRVGAQQTALRSRPAAPHARDEHPRGKETNGRAPVVDEYEHHLHLRVTPLHYRETTHVRRRSHSRRLIDQAQSVRAPSPSSYSLRARHTRPGNAPRPTGSSSPLPLAASAHIHAHVLADRAFAHSFHHRASRPASPKEQAFDAPDSIPSASATPTSRRRSASTFTRTLCAFHSSSVHPSHPERTLAKPRALAQTRVLRYRNRYPPGASSASLSTSRPDHDEERASQLRARILHTARCSPRALADAYASRVHSYRRRVPRLGCTSISSTEGQTLQPRAA